jgi:hypothetical protein
VTIGVGELITARDYNETAWLVNRVWADATDIPHWDTRNIPVNPKEYFVRFSSVSSTNIVNEDNADVIGFAASIGSAERTFQLNPIPSNSDLIVVYLDGLAIPKSSVWEIDYSTGVLTLKGTGYDTDESQNESYTSKQLVVYNRESHTFGWGQGRFDSNISSGAVAEVQAHELITAAHMNALINRVNVMLRHVGSDLVIDRLNAGELIYAAHALEIRDLLINTVIKEPFNTHMTMDIENISSMSNTVTHTRNNDWGYQSANPDPAKPVDNQAPTNMVLAATRYKFADYSTARYFFNAGSQIRFDIEIFPSGYANDIGTEYWRTLVSSLGTVSMDWTQVTSTTNYIHGESRELGFYELGRNYQLVYTAQGHQGTAYNQLVGTPGYNTYSGYHDPAKERVDVMARLIDKNAGPAFYTVDPSHPDAVYVDLQVMLLSETPNPDMAIIGTTRVNMHFVAADNYTNHVSYSTHKPYDMQVLDNTDEGPEVDFEIINDNYNS